MDPCLCLPRVKCKIAGARGHPHCGVKACGCPRALSCDHALSEEAPKLAAKQCYFCKSTDKRSYDSRWDGKYEICFACRRPWELEPEGVQHVPTARRLPAVKRDIPHGDQKAMTEHVFGDDILIRGLSPEGPEWPGEEVRVEAFDRGANEWEG